MQKIKTVSIIAASFVLLIASGCQLLSSPSSRKSEKRVESARPKLSDEEYKKVKALVHINTTSVSPNSVGFMTFYGEVANRSNKTIRKAVLVVVSMAERKGADISPAGQIGRTEVKNLGPGETKTFNITSSMESSESSGYFVKLEDIEL